MSDCDGLRWSLSGPVVDDDDLHDILQLADIIRANPIYDDADNLLDSDLAPFFDLDDGHNSLLYRTV